MASITEIAPDVFRICTFVPDFNLGFSQFLVRDDEPLLFHTGMRAFFPGTREAVSKIIEPDRLRWISFCHFEADECGSLNEWLAVAPAAEPACSEVGALVSVNDFASRPARMLANGETFSTGNKRWRFVQTPHVPHCWDAGMLFEETTGTLFCSDLFDQRGDVDPVTESDILAAHRESLLRSRGSTFANYFPWTPNTAPLIERLAALRPRVLATMHGSVYRGDGERLLRELVPILREAFSEPDLPQ